MTSGAVTDGGNTRVLADSHKLPMLGLGVWQVPNGSECVSTVRSALDVGYRHIDTAQAYGNEESVGRALRESDIPREELFITTKFYPESADPSAEAEHSLRRLRLDYVDLYIIHWPKGGATWAWPGMEKAHERGHARSIGVSNFSVTELDEVSAVASVAPVVNQVQFSPFAYRSALLDDCRRRNIALEAYSPLGVGAHLSNPAIVAIAKRLGRTPAQVLLRWCLQHDVPVLTKSTRRERLEENAQIFGFALSDEDMSELDRLDQTGGTAEARETTWW